MHAGLETIVSSGLLLEPVPIFQRTVGLGQARLVFNLTKTHFEQSSEFLKLRSNFALFSLTIVLATVAGLILRHRNSPGASNTEPKNGFNR